jgi:hypothetical protein
MNKSIIVNGSLKSHIQPSNKYCTTSNLNIEKSDEDNKLTENLLIALDKVNQNSRLFRNDFSNWLKNNWQIWMRFQDEANKVWDHGRRHYSARTLVEFIRHETFLRQTNLNFKINNSYVPDIGRLYGILNEDRADFFECRVMSEACVRARIRSNAIN